MSLTKSRHVIQFMGLSALFEVVGMSLQQFGTSSLLNALPLSFTFAAVVNWALPQQAKPAPEEHYV
jgi:hypothetical protein